MKKPDKLDNPCDICLVRACCSESCDILKKYLLEAVHRLALFEDDEVINNFTEEQRVLVYSVVKTIQRDLGGVEELLKNDRNPKDK